MTDHKKIWNILYKDKLEATDYSGRVVKKEAYNQSSSRYGWVVELVNPNKEATLDNLQIVSIYANLERNNRVNFSIDGIAYSVRTANKKSIIAKVDLNQTSNIWKQIFGSKKTAIDFCGRKINRDSDDWDVDHIMPFSLGGENTSRNKQIAHKTSNQEKADKTTFIANGQTFQVKKNKQSMTEKNNFYDYSNCDYSIVLIDQMQKAMSKTEFWENEFKQRTEAKDFDEVNIYLNRPDDWVIECINQDENCSEEINNLHIVSRVVHEIRGGRPNFSIYDKKNGCNCYYRLKKNNASLSKEEMNEVYDYTNKSYFLERYDIVFDDDEEDYD